VRAHSQKGAPLKPYISATATANAGAQVANVVIMLFIFFSLIVVDLAIG
jgi:hypothetical protein